MIKELLGSNLNMSANAWQYLEQLEVEERIRRGVDFIVKGKPHDAECIVIEGVCRSYVVNPEGDEVTLSFYTQGMVLSPLVTRLKDGLSTVNFHACTDLRILNLEAKQFEQLMVDDLEIRSFGNAILQLELQRMVGKEIGMASLTAKQRLLGFRSNYPMLENVVPHSEIASYLGITAISLSRLRGELAR